MRFFCCHFKSASDMLEIQGPHLMIKEDSEGHRLLQVITVKKEEWKGKLKTNPFYGVGTLL